MRPRRTCEFTHYVLQPPIIVTLASSSLAILRDHSLKLRCPFASRASARCAMLTSSTTARQTGEICRSSTIRRPLDRVYLPRLKLRVHHSSRVQHTQMPRVLVSARSSVVSPNDGRGVKKMPSEAPASEASVRTHCIRSPRAADISCHRRSPSGSRPLFPPRSWEPAGTLWDTRYPGPWLGSASSYCPYMSESPSASPTLAACSPRNQCNNFSSSCFGVTRPRPITAALTPSLQAPTSAPIA